MTDDTPGYDLRIYHRAPESEQGNWISYSRDALAFRQTRAQAARELRELADRIEQDTRSTKR